MPSTRTYDTVVLGAGVFGLASAWRLAQTGRSVLVLDRSPVGSEASGKAAGRVDPVLGGAGHKDDDAEIDALRQPFTKPAAERNLAPRSHRLHLDLADEIMSISGIDYDMDDQPSLQLFYSAEGQAEGQRVAPEWTRDGYKSELLDVAGIKKLDSRFTPPEFGGLLVYGPVFIDSLKFSRALAECAKQAGAVIEQTEAHGLTSGSGNTVVHTDTGDVEAGETVVALGPWTGSFLDGLRASCPVVPTRGEILHMSVPPGGPFRVHIHGHSTLVLKKDGLVWVGATSEKSEFDRSPTEFAREHLLEFARQTMPAMAQSPIVRQTVCFRPASPDGLPLVGRVPKLGNVWVASGGTGWGIMHSLIVGQEVSDMVSRGANDPETAAFSLARFSGAHD